MHLPHLTEKVSDFVFVATPLIARQYRMTAAGSNFKSCGEVKIAMKLGSLTSGDETAQKASGEPLALAFLQGIP